jgi:hypothetical protein
VAGGRSRLRAPGGAEESFRLGLGALRLLLDVHFSPLIAAQLHDRGHDVRAAADDALVRQLSDEALLEHAVAGARALLTNNARDFLPIVGQWARAGRDHYGLLLTSDRSMPRDRKRIGRFVVTLDALLAQHSDEGAFKNRVFWLTS